MRPAVEVRGRRGERVVRPSTLGELVDSGYRPRTVREEMRANLAARLRAHEPFMPEMIGYAEMT